MTDEIRKCLTDIVVSRIVATRNRIIHAYDAVNDTVVWSIVIKHLPILKGEIVQLLENANDSIP